MNGRVSALVLLAAFGAAGAQSTRAVQVEAGGAQVQQTGRTATQGAVVASAVFRDASPLIATLLSAAYTRAGDSVSAAQATAALSFRASERSAWQTEAGIVGAAFGSGFFSRGGSFSGSARERFLIGAGGLWAGGSYGGTSRDAVGSHSSAIEAGGWIRRGDFEVTLGLTRLHSNDLNLLEAAGIFADSTASAIDLTDAVAEVRYEHGPLLIAASEAWRNGNASTYANQNAFYVSATWAISPRFALSVGTGRLLADPVRGVPDVSITSATLRVSFAPHPGAPTEARASSYATVEPKSAGALLTVRVPADNDATVEVAGSFSDWKPVPLTRTSAGWEAQIALMSGRHRVAVRINGGPWKAPAGTAHVRDEFGGEAGLIVVP